jgi:hypothetical protein
LSQVENDISIATLFRPKRGVDEALEFFQISFPESGDLEPATVAALCEAFCFIYLEGEVGFIKKQDDSGREESRTSRMPSDCNATSLPLLIPSFSTA